jgi:hypothetical protein
VGYARAVLGRSPGELTALFCCLIWDSTNLEGLAPVFRSHVSAVRNCQYYHWEGCMGSMQCNVEFGYQLSICSATKENHGKPWSSWTVAGPSECNWLLASSPALNPRTLTLVHTLCYCIFLFCFFFFSFSLPLTTRRDYDGSILTRLHTRLNQMGNTLCLLPRANQQETSCSTVTPLSR